MLNLTLLHTMESFNNTEERHFENIVTKAENAGDERFFLSQQCFLHCQRKLPLSKLDLIRRWQMLSTWTSLKFFSFDEELVAHLTRFRSNFFRERKLIF